MTLRELADQVFDLILSTDEELISYEDFYIAIVRLMETL